MKKSAREWVEDVKKVNVAANVLGAYDYFNGELEQYAGAFVGGEIACWEMAELTDDEFRAVVCYVETGAKSKAAAAMDYSTVWYNSLFERAIMKLNAFLASDRKYNRFKGEYDPDLI